MSIDPQSDFHGFLAIATPLAVIIAAIIHKLDSMGVRRRLEKSSKERDKKLDQIHHLVDGSLAENLRLSVLQTARIAQLTGDERDTAIAAEAARKYEDHLARMARVEFATAIKQPSGSDVSPHLPSHDP